MGTILFIVLGIAIGMRLVPILDALTDWVNHLIAIQIQKCEVKIRNIALTAPPEEQYAMPQIGFTISPDPEEDDLEDD